MARREFGENGRMKWVVAAVGSGATLCAWLYTRYAASDVMKVSLTEFSNAEYPLDPARRSVRFGSYTGRTVLEYNTGRSYLKDWLRMEHWINPAGTFIDLGMLRQVISEWNVETDDRPNEPVVAVGEQANKRHTLVAPNVRHWGDFSRRAEQIRFARFAPPGVYTFQRPWKNEFWRFAKLRQACFRSIRSPGHSTALHELELVYEARDDVKTRFVVSGFDGYTLPQLEMREYAHGFSMPMGIAVPPFLQRYEDLVKNPPDRSPYFSMLMDPDGRWLNHHAIGIDGVVMYRDRDDALLLHVLPLSYERHTLISHHLVAMPHALGVEPLVEEGAPRSTSPEAADHGRDQSAREVSS